MRDSGPSAPPQTGGGSGDNRPLPWLLRQKIAIPDRVLGYFDRVELKNWAMPTRRRLTILSAPGGFGKTTLLAECCRYLRDDGIPVAWVAADEHDEPGVFDTYVAYACQSAVAGAAEGPKSAAVAELGKARVGTESRTALAMREVAALDGPFVLVFDELERLGNPDSVALVDFLVKRGPPNLHLAVACRQIPGGVDVTGTLLQGRAVIVSAEALRFSMSEVANFFDRKLTQSQLAALMSESAGWPFALRISKNEIVGKARGDTVDAQVIVENWVDSRLFAGLGAEDREYVLDIGLFEWMDAALLDEVLERNDSMLRIKTMSVLVGMLEPVRDGGTEVWRLHPLIREHCVRRRFVETPERFRTIHRRIAAALARRGQTAAAMRHAADAGEPSLTGDILEQAGGVRLLSREGAVEFQAADRRLTEDVIQARPRLALVRCLSRILSGQTEEAKDRYRSLSGVLAALEADAGDGALELTAEKCVVRGMIALYGGERFGSELMQTHLADVARLAKSPYVDRLTRGIMEYSLCIAGTMTANFEAALEHAALARPYLAQSRYMRMFVDLQAGQVAMARGRVREAAALYRRAERVAKATYVLGPEPTAICGVLFQELFLECSRVPDLELTHVPEALVTGSSPFQGYAAASGVAVDLRLRYEGVDAARGSADQMLDYVRGAGLPALVRYVSALRIALLAIAGRLEEGEKAWVLDALPRGTAGCLDLSGQTWREMEAISCARLRLMIGGERFEEGRGFAKELRAVAAGRGLRRTLMRALALSVVFEQRAGDTAAALGHVGDYVRLYAKAPYTEPMVRERADCADIVGAFLESAHESAARDAARSLLDAMERADDPSHPLLTVREREVLERLEAEGDKQIAAALGLSTHGVRFHLRKLFTKFGVRNRAEAVRRAREMGLIPSNV